MAIAVNAYDARATNTPTPRPSHRKDFPMAQKRDYTIYGTCSGCDARWTGTRPCHCSRCHQTLAGIGMFDAHQTKAGCKTPQESGATRLADGIWRGPEWDRSTLDGAA